MDSVATPQRNSEVGLVRTAFRGKVDPNVAALAICSAHSRSAFEAKMPSFDPYNPSRRVQKIHSTSCDHPNQIRQWASSESQEKM
jgi:hypothetical protein